MNRLKQVRLELGLSQQDLADKIGEKRYRINDMESEKIKIQMDFAEKIEDQFNINGWWLLTGRGEMLSENNIHVGDELRESMQSALIVLQESELAAVIREATVEKILEKLTMPRGILAKAFNFLTYQRPLVFLKLIMSHIKPDIEPSTTYKQHLVQAIESLNLQTIQNILGPAFTPSSKKYMIGRIMELSEDECKIIVSNSNQMLELIESKMPLFIKLP